MCQPKKWWWGLAPLALLLLLAMNMKGTPVEGDLNSRAQAEFQRSGLPWAKISVTGRDAVVSGEAPEPDLQKLAISAAERAWGVRQVADKTLLTAEARPYVATATRDGDKITLTGFIPHDGIREEFVKAAKASFPKAEVVDQMKISRGMPAAFVPGMAYGFSQLGKLAKGSFDMADNAFSITGVTKDLPTYETMIQTVKSVPAGVTLAKADISAPDITPYTWSATRNGSGLTLSGFVPNQKTREAILSSARVAIPSVTIVDQMRLAPGASNLFGIMSDFGLAQLAKLTKGTASLTDSVLSLTGEAPTQAAYDSVTSALKSLPQGASLGKVAVETPNIKPYEWSASRANGEVKLAGFVPSEDLRGQIVGTAKKLFPTDRILDAMTLGQGAPAGFGSVAELALNELSQLVSGSVSMTGTSLKVTGEALSAGVGDAVKSMFGKLPAGFSGISTIKVKIPEVVVPAIPQPAVEIPPAPVVSIPAPPPITETPALKKLSETAQKCQVGYKQLLDQGQILFNTGSATIREESSDLLDNLAKAAKACPDYKLLIAGHTDSVGDPAANQSLSERRARAVQNYMEELGVRKGQLSARGFGDTMPIAPNDTAENKSKNRRIEFEVIED